MGAGAFEYNRRVLLKPQFLQDRNAPIERVIEAAGRVILGKEPQLRLALACLLARGHLLIEDLPGVGKTTLALVLARSLGLQFQRIQFTSDMLPSDVLGISMYSAVEESFEFKRGPIFTNILLADEINRTTPKTQSALLEAMNERQVTVDGYSHALPNPFLVVATQNPVEHHGTYPLPESQLDRFLIRARMGYPAPGSEREILRGRAGAVRLDELRPVLSAAEVIALQEEVSAVCVEDSLIEYALAIVERTRQHEQLSLGVSPRGALMLYRAAQAMALLEGRGFCTPDDFKKLAVPTFAHRLVISARYASTLKRTEQCEQILREVVDSIPVPV